MRQKKQLDAILPHQNEHRPATLFFHIMKQLKRREFDISCWQITGTLNKGIAYRKTLAAHPEYSVLSLKEPETMAKLVDFVFGMNDVYHRAKLIDQRISINPKAFVLEIHGAGIPHNIAGSGSPDEVDLGKGFSAIPFLHLFERFDYYPKDGYAKLLTDLAKLAGFNLNAGYTLLSQIAKRLEPHKKRIISLEVPATKALPLIIKGKPNYQLYYDSDGKLHLHITNYEQLYCLHDLHGGSFNNEDVNRVTSLVLAPEKLF